MVGGRFRGFPKRAPGNPVKGVGGGPGRRLPRRRPPEAPEPTAPITEEPAAVEESPVAPTPGEAPGRRLRLFGWLAVLALAVAVGGSIVLVSGPPTEAELREQAGLLGKDTLRIGVKNDTPGIARRDRDGGRFTGFEIDIAYMIAADLGFRPSQVEFLSIKTEDRARRQALDSAGAWVPVDLVVATFSITEDRLRDPSVSFSKPYLKTEQSVVTREDHPKVTSLRQLKGEKVCTLGTSTSEQALARLGIDATAKNQISDCVKGLTGSEREFDAVTTDAAILAGFVTEAKGALVHHDIAHEVSEMWAVNAGPNTALRTLVDLSLYRSYADPDDRRWEDAYDKHIRPLFATNDGVNIAHSEQPCAPAPEVRRWPWERGLPVERC